jgi:hypothetical protein
MSLNSCVIVIERVNGIEITGSCPKANFNEKHCPILIEKLAF